MVERQSCGMRVSTLDALAPVELNEPQTDTVAVEQDVEDDFAAFRAELLGASVWREFRPAMFA
jgi:hypothetical protein